MESVSLQRIKPLDTARDVTTIQYDKASKMCCGVFSREKTCLLLRRIYLKNEFTVSDASVATGNAGMARMQPIV